MRKEIEGRKWHWTASDGFLVFIFILSCTMNITDKGIFLPTFEFLPVLFW